MYSSILVYVLVLTNTIQWDDCDADYTYQKLVYATLIDRNPDYELLAWAKEINHNTCGYSKWEYGIGEKNVKHE